VFRPRSPGTPNRMREVRVYGVDIHDIYARRLIRALTDTGTPASLAAAKQIAGGLERNDSAGPLTPEMRDAILAALQLPAQAGMKNLYRALLQDQDARRDS
jgi:hypothetical protein